MRMIAKTCDCKNLLPMDAIMQYIYATCNAFILETMRFVAQTFVYATDSIEHAVETLWIKMAAGDTSVGSTPKRCGFSFCTLLVESKSLIYNDHMNKPEIIPNPVKHAKPAVTPVVEAEVRKRLKTLPQDAKAARPYNQVHADLIRPYVPK